ncbi:MAG: hypothetical protein Q9211_004630 [Gyalolechia sp. 1 TL-2023]
MAPTKRSHDQTLHTSASFDSDEVADNTRQAVKRRRVDGSSEGERGNGARRGQVSASGLPDGGCEAVIAGKGVRYNLPPMSEFPEMMEDMVARAMVVPRFLGAIKALALARKGQKLAFDHLFSAEIVQYKQAYIERNFSPSIIFSDIRDMVKHRQAITAYGGMADVPDGVSLLVAGSSCVDFSRLNPHSRGIDESGESGETFRAILHYARRYRPRAMILENVKSAAWDVIEAYAQNDQSHPKIQQYRSQGQLQAIWGDNSPDSGYSTEHLIVDSKDYYLPQTRSRGYMLCIDRSKIGRAAADQLVRQWSPVFKFLRRPVSSPMEELFLPADHPSLLRAREFGHLDEHGEKKVRKETKWHKCRVRYAKYRGDLNLGNKRPLTNSVEGGPISPPEHWAKLWASVQPDRLKEHWDQAHLRNVRVGNFDSQDKTRVWELSQNIDRATDTSPWGLAPCVTPTGVPFATTRGGLLTAFESLRLQGQPLDRIDTGNIGESSVQDLAGNAMSTTVVAAAMIALLTTSPIYLVTGLLPDSSPNATLTDELPTIMSDTHLRDFQPVDLIKISSATVAELISAAESSIRRCACEGQHGNTSFEIFGCLDCDHTTCAKCKSNFVHRYSKLSNLDRSTPPNFVNEVKDALPMRLQLTGNFVPESIRHHRLSDEAHQADLANVIAALDRAGGEEFRLHDVIRSHCWTVTFDGKSLSLKLIFHHGNVKWQLFIKPHKSLAGTSRIRQLARYPIARMTLDDGARNLLDGTWQVSIPIVQSYDIKIVGQGERSIDSWKNTLGLPDHADSKVHEYLDLFTDAEIVEGGHVIRLAGTYQLLPKCETASAGLHKKTTPESDGSQIYFFLDPQRISHPSTDRYVFAHTTHRLAWGEVREVIARLETAWMPDDQTENVTAAIQGEWVPCDWQLMPYFGSEPISYAAMENNPPIQIPNGLREQDLRHVLPTADCNTSHLALLSLRLPIDVLDNQSSTERAVSRSVQQAISRQFAWVFQRLYWPSIFSNEWMQFPNPTTSDICQKCAPTLPDIRFGRSKAGARTKICPYEHPKQAAKFEKKFKARLPIIISTLRADEVDNQAYGRLDVGVNWASLMHRAMGKLPFQFGDTVNLKGRIETIAQDQSSIKLPKFTLPDSRHCPQATYDFPTGERLRAEQLRALQQMLYQEDDTLEKFPEQAREEAALREYGLRVHALFSKYGVFLGGVLAHEVGFGKTAIVLALIDATQVPNLIPDEIHGKISCKATLILVPATIVKQWDVQIKKFLGSRYEIVVIPDIAALGRCTVDDIQKADIVVFNSKILSSAAYLEGISGLGNLPVQHNNSDRLFQAWYDWASRNMDTNIEDMKSNGLTNISKTLIDRYVDTYHGDQLVRPVTSHRLRGQAYANDALNRAQQDIPTVVDVAPDQRDDGGDVEEQNANDEGNAIGGTEQQNVSGEGNARGGFQPQNVEVQGHIGGVEQIILDDEDSDDVTEGDDEGEDGQTADDMDGVVMGSGSGMSGGNGESGEEKLFGVDVEPEPVGAYELLTQLEADRVARQQAERVAREAAAAAGEEDLDQKGESQQQSAPQTKAEIKAREKSRQNAFQDAARAQKRFKFAKQTDLSKMSFPILQMFHFRRLVLDEYTYVDDVAHILIAALHARRRWVLSGTPKLGDFMDIKKLARFIKFDLGEDDDTPGVMKQYNIVKLRKEQTAAEEFRGLNKQRTMEFHLDRHLYAQEWLDRFARQDQPEFAEIKVVTKYEGVQLTCTERAHLLEMMFLVQDSQVAMKTPKTGLSRLPDDKLDHIKSFMKGQTDAVKALLAIICEKYSPHLNGASSAAEASFNKRIEEYQSLMRHVAYNLRKAVFLHGRFTTVFPELEHASPWWVWVTEMTTGHGGGISNEVLPKIVRMISRMQYDENEAEIFMKSKPERRDEESSDDDGPTAKKETKSEMLDRLMKTLSITRDPRHVDIPAGNVDGYIAAIKHMVNECSHRAEEMVRRIQAIRLAKTLLKCRAWIASTGRSRALLNLPTATDPPQCFVCTQPCMDPATTMVLGSCGHTICDGCFSSTAVDGDKCPVPDCDAVIMKSNLYTAKLLGTENNDRYASRHGAKVGKIIELLNHDIPRDEQVLVFVQDDRFIAMISKALEDEGISHYALADNKKASHGKWMFSFQEDTGIRARRVLILDATKDSAAGANLTNANHVIFLGTLWTEDSHTYHQSLIQCIGRSNRFGQRKTVFVYRLLALNTVDVDVLEWREDKKLVEQPDGTLDLVEDSQLTAPQRAMDFSTGFLRDNGYFDREE